MQHQSAPTWKEIPKTSYHSHSNSLAVQMQAMHKSVRHWHASSPGSRCYSTNKAACGRATPEDCMALMQKH